ncbi:MAG: hypothetical protein K2P35_08115, partial [Lachnospiraceae bacterium]|nr:hypothetical protein [Lachnospiraceae bacterium]
SAAARTSTVCVPVNVKVTYSLCQPLSNSCSVVPVSVLLRYVSVPAFTSMYAFEDAASSYILKITFNFI